MMLLNAQFTSTINAQNSNDESVQSRRAPSKPYFLPRSVREKRTNSEPDIILNELASLFDGDSLQCNKSENSSSEDCSGAEAGLTLARKVSFSVLPSSAHPVILFCPLKSSRAERERVERIVVHLYRQNWWLLVA